jgi:methionyl-tRNA formyltransferase
MILNVSIGSTRQPWMSWKFIRRRGLVSFLDLLLGQALLPVRAVARRIRPSRLATEGKPSAFAAQLAEIRKRAAELPHDYKSVQNVNGEEAIQAVRSFAPDVTILCGAPIVRKRFIESAGVLINPHCGIAPHYKGSSPAHWAVYRGDWDNIGFTIHVVTPDVDGGPVLCQETVQPRADWTMTDLDWHLVRSMYEKLVELIHAPDFRERLSAAEPQREKGVNWPPMGHLRKAKTERALRRRGAATRSQERSA